MKRNSLISQAIRRQVLNCATATVRYQRPLPLPNNRALGDSTKEVLSVLSNRKQALPNFDGSGHLCHVLGGRKQIETAVTQPQVAATPNRSSPGMAVAQ